MTNGGMDNECLCAVGERCVGDCIGDIDTLFMGTQMCEGEKLVTSPLWKMDVRDRHVRE